MKDLAEAARDEVGASAADGERLTPVVVTDSDPVASDGVAGVSSSVDISDMDAVTTAGIDAVRCLFVSRAACTPALSPAAAHRCGFIPVDPPLVGPQHRARAARRPCGASERNAGLTAISCIDVTAWTRLVRLRGPRMR